METQGTAILISWEIQSWTTGLTAGCWEGGGHVGRCIFRDASLLGMNQIFRDMCQDCVLMAFVEMLLLNCHSICHPWLFDTKGLLEACCQDGLSLGTRRRSSSPISVLKTVTIPSAMILLIY